MTREDAIDIIKSECYVFNPLNFDRSTIVNTALDMAIKALEQKPCEDAISRQAVLDEAFEVDTKEYGRTDVVGVDAIDALPSVTPSYNSIKTELDCISRQAAIDELCKMLHDCFWADDEELDAVITTLNELPPVTPQPKIGRWEWVQYDGNPNIGNWHCSECRTIIPHMPEKKDNTPIYKWCPMCGAKMEVSE